MEKLDLTRVQADEMVSNLEAFTPEERVEVVASYEQIHKTQEEFKASLTLQGMELIMIEADGNCLFRACSQILYGTQEHHKMLREAACRYIAKNPNACGLREGEDRNKGLKSYDGDLGTYLKDLAKETVWGDDAALRAICQVHQRYAVVYVSSAGEGAVEHPEFRAEDNVAGLPLLPLANTNGLSHFNALESTLVRSLRLKTKPGKIESKI